MQDRFNVTELVRPPSITEGGTIAVRLGGVNNGVGSGMDIVLSRTQAMFLAADLMRIISDTKD